MRTLVIRTLLVMAVATGLAMAVGGCASTAANALLYDFTSEKAEVGVPYNILGPSRDDARLAAMPVGMEHCDSMGKTAKPISWRKVPTGDYDGNYIFLYRCEGADRVTVD